MQPLPRVLTSSDLSELRVWNGVAERKVRDGEWQRGARGVLLTCAEEPTAADLVAMARAHVGPHFVMTGLLVLAELGLPWLPAVEAAHVLVPPEVRRRGGKLLRVTRTSGYDELRTWRRYDALLARPDRAVVDAARAQSSLREVRGIVLGAVSRKAVTPQALHAVLDAGQRNGSALTRRAVRDAERGCASPPEAELVDALIGKGVPFYVNPKIYLGDVLLGSTDVWLVGRGVGGEVESVEWHGDDEQTESTYDRHERMTAPGLELVHLSVRRVRADVEEAAGHLLSTTPVTEPPGLRVVPRGPLLR
jgi:hypothetical protein